MITHILCESKEKQAQHMYFELYRKLETPNANKIDEYTLMVAKLYLSKMFPENAIDESLDKAYRFIVLKFIDSVNGLVKENEDRKVFDQYTKAATALGRSGILLANVQQSNIMK